MEDKRTTNTDFIKVSRQINSELPLFLIDESLAGLDLRSPYISFSIDLQMRIINECIVNPWYFFREVLNLKLNQGTCAMLYLAQYHSNMVVWLPRQSGVDETIQAIILYRLLFRQNISDLTVGRNKITAASYRNALTRHLNTMPFIRQSISYDNNIVANIIARNKVEYNGPWHPLNDYRVGKEYNLLTFSDIEFDGNIAHDFLFSLAQCKKSKDNYTIAHTHGIPERIREKNKDMQTFYNMIHNNVLQRFNSSFYNLQLSTANKATFLIAYTYEELGYTEDWFKIMCKCLNNESEKIRSELLVEV